MKENRMANPALVWSSAPILGPTVSVRTIENELS